MTIQQNEDRVHGRGRNPKGRSLLETAARNRNEQKRREWEIRAEDHAERTTEPKTWGNLLWSNLQV